MGALEVNGKEFKLSLPAEDIQQIVDDMAVRMNADLAGHNPLFVAVLNGAFMFAGDLMKRMKIDCEISFVKMASYEGTSSSGDVKTLLGLDVDVEDRLVVILEDIIDSGLTLEALVNELSKLKPKELKVAVLLLKPDAYSNAVEIDYVGKEVSNEFLIGYGLDYNGRGRNLEDIYILTNEEIPITEF